MVLASRGACKAWPMRPPPSAASGLTGASAGKPRSTKRCKPDCRWPALSDCRGTEAVWVDAEGVVEGLLAGGMDLVGQTVVDLVGGHQADAQMVMVLVVPVEEGAAEGLGVLDGAEPLGELGLVFQGLEAALREGIVVGGVGRGRGCLRECLRPQARG